MTSKWIVSQLAAACLLWIVPCTARAADVCGDPTGAGQATVTNAVMILREAAGLRSPCRLRICDVDLDGRVGVSDGVLMLRVAAAIPSAKITCAQAEVDRQIGRFTPVTKIKDTAASAGLARPAGVGTPCADGGRTEIRDDGFEDFDCNQDGKITDGRVVIAERPGTDGVDVTFAGFTVQYLDDDERVVLNGALVFNTIPGNGTALAVDGAVAAASSVRGDFTDNLIGLVVSNTAPTEGQVLAGTFRTEITRGIGPYARLVTLESQLFTSGLRIARLELVGGGTSAYVLGGQSRLCEPCTDSTACGDGLSCRSCVTDCSASTRRCAVGDPTTSCDDGDY